MAYLEVKHECNSQANASNFVDVVQIYDDEDAIPEPQKIDQISNSIAHEITKDKMKSETNDVQRD